MKTVKSAHSCIHQNFEDNSGHYTDRKIKIISLDQDRLVSKFHGTLSLSDQCSTAIVAAAMPFNSARVSGVRVTWPAARFSRRWATRRCARDQQDVGRSVQQPRQRDLNRRGPEPTRDGRQGKRLQRREPAEREERYVRDALPGQLVDQGVVVALGQVVVVLHAHDVGDRLRLGDLGGRDVAQADVADSPLRRRSASTVTCSAMDPSSGPWPDPITR